MTDQEKLARALADEPGYVAGVDRLLRAEVLRLRGLLAGDMAANNQVNHPSHYGGAENPYEAIRVIEAWGLGFCLGNAVKYLCRAGKKGAPQDYLTDLKKAVWYINREIEQLKEKVNATGIQS